jgi:hypothetical protein
VGNKLIINPTTGLFDLVNPSGGSSSSDNFSYDYVSSILIIPIHQQMLIYDELVLDTGASVILNGELVIEGSIVTSGVLNDTHFTGRTLKDTLEQLVIPNSAVWESQKKDVLAGATTAIDSNGMTDFKVIKYTICVSRGTDVVMFDMNLINKNPDISTIIYGKIGAGISYSLNVSVVSGIMYVNVTNNEATTLSTGLIKYKFI